MTQIMKKKIISVVLGFFVVASTLFTILALNITPVTLKRDIFEYEYGSVISNNPADYVNANESVINEVKLNFSNLKNEIGLYKVSATYAGVELPFYIKIKWGLQRESNPRPQPYQGCALPTELCKHI